jgi:hypothetical protein
VDSREDRIGARGLGLGDLFGQSHPMSIHHLDPQRRLFGACPLEAVVALGAAGPTEGLFLSELLSESVISRRDLQSHHGLARRGWRRSRASFIGLAPHPLADDKSTYASYLLLSCSRTSVLIKLRRMRVHLASRGISFPCESGARLAVLPRVDWGDVPY